MPNNFNRHRRGASKFVGELKKVNRALLSRQVTVLNGTARSSTQDYPATTGGSATLNFAGGTGTGGSTSKIAD